MYKDDTYDVRNDFEKEYPEVYAVMWEIIYRHGGGEMYIKRYGLIFEEERLEFSIKIEQFNKIDQLNCEGLLSFINKINEKINVDFRDGDEDGSVIVDYGKDTTHEPKPQYSSEFVVDENLKNNDIEKYKLAKRVFKSKNKEHQEMCRKMSYDNWTGACSLSTYHDYMKKWGLSVEYTEVERD